MNDWIIGFLDHCIIRLLDHYFIGSPKGMQRLIWVAKIKKITSKSLEVGGGTKCECCYPKWILMSFQYIRMGEKEFLNLVTILTLHIDPQNLKIPIIGQKNKVVVNPIYGCQNLSGEKYKSNGKRISSIRHTSEEKNPKKPSENATFLKFGIFGWFFGFFSSLVCRIELILFSIAFAFFSW